MKHKFKVGDRVKRKSRPDLGEIVEIIGGNIFVKWLTGPFSSLSLVPVWYPRYELEFAETPIERMKRKYNEEVGGNND